MWCYIMVKKGEYISFAASTPDKFRDGATTEMSIIIELSEKIIELEANINDLEKRIIELEKR